MTKFHSHYESLNVTRDAPPEVIRAAYRSLSQKHHPDKNRGDDEAARLMARLNAAYSVLSDAEQRELYDLQIQSEQQRIREPFYGFQTSVDDGNSTVPYTPFTADKAGRARHPAAETPEGKAGKKPESLFQHLGNYAKGREVRIAAAAFALFSAAILAVLWFIWKDNQSMLRLEQAAVYAPGMADATPEEPAKAKPSGVGVIQISGPSGLDASTTELSKPAAAPKAPAAPSAAAKLSDYERLTAMLKNMGLGLHKLDLPGTAPNAKQAPAPAKAAEPAKASAAQPPVQAARTGAAPEASRAREENERPAAPEPARSETKSVAEASRASAPAVASATAAAASASRAPRSAVVVDARACPTPKYPPNSYYNGESGSVLLALLVGSDGKVIESKVQKSSGFPELDRAARRALAQCKFQAASGDGQGEPVWTNLTYVWSID